MTLSFDELLKFRLLADGVNVSHTARSAWLERYGGPLTLAEYATTSGIALVLPGELYANAPLTVHDDAPVLHFAHDEFCISYSDCDTPVDVVPVPLFHSETQIDERDGRAYPHTKYGVTHTDRCRVSPITGCAWRCKFCDLPYEFDYEKRHAENLLNVIRVAEHDPLAPARHVLVSGGTPRRGRYGASDEEWIDETYAYLAANSPLPVDVMMPPRRDMGHPERLASTGVNAVSINMEISDIARARTLAPAKSKLGRDHYLSYLEKAVESFGVGRVQSLIVFGSAIEPLESTLRGVRDLVDRGCIPVLSPFRPSPSTPMRALPGATMQEMIDVYLETLEICDAAANGVKPGPRCVPCHHNTVTLPDDSAFYKRRDADVTDRCMAF